MPIEYTGIIDEHLTVCNAVGVFDVSQDRVDPELIYLYEIYRDDAAYEAHTQTAHFRDSRPLVEPLILEQECFESDVIARNPVY